MAKSEPYEVARDLLRLRRWAVGALSADSSNAERIEGISFERWRLFLSLERCAAILLDRIGQDANNLVDEQGLDALRKVAATEMQSYLRARVDGRELAVIAQRLSFPVIVLKGGVGAIAGDDPVIPMGDIDILVDRANVDDMVQVLTSAGFGERTRDLDHHHSVEPTSERMRVEVHWSTHDDGSTVDRDLWNRARPIDNAQPLRKLGARDNVVHLVEHAVDMHRERSVGLRDIILIGTSAAECTVDELRSAKKDLAAIPANISLLDFAIELKRAAPQHDPFLIGCASFYSAVALADDLPAPLSTRGALAFVTTIDQARVPHSTTFRRTLKWRGTGVDRLSSAANRFPQLGKFLVAPMRLGYYCIVAALTLPAIRRTQRKALRSFELQTR